MKKGEPEDHSREKPIFVGLNIADPDEVSFIMYDDE